MSRIRPVGNYGGERSTLPQIQRKPVASVARLYPDLDPVQQIFRIGFDTTSLSNPERRGHREDAFCSSARISSALALFAGVPPRPRPVAAGGFVGAAGVPALAPPAPAALPTKSMGL